MMVLRIYLNYGSVSPGSVFPAPLQRASALGVALPVKVLDAQGTVLADAIASSQEPAEVEISGAYREVFVRLAWPSGRTETKKVALSAPGPSDVIFSDERISKNEWSAWAILRLNQRTQRADIDSPIDVGIGRYAKVWLRIWRFEDTQWKPTPIAPSEQYKNDAARQIDLHLEPYPHLLQIGGSDVPWRFVALPGGGPCRVLLTPNDSNDPRADPLMVVVTSFRTDAETLLEFLARDSVRAATTMAASEAMARELFAYKFEDPLAAMAGGYFLLRIENWDRVPLSWWESLSNRFPWVPDTAILLCVRLLRAGLEGGDARGRALYLFKTCLNRGWPVYEEGLRLLQEAGALLRHIANTEDAPYFSRVETLVTAKTWAGAALSFYGRDPAKPSAVLWVGMPQAPRRQRLAFHEWEEQISDLNVWAAVESGIANASTASRQLTAVAFTEEFAPKNLRRTTDSLASPLSAVERIQGGILSGRRSIRPKAQSKAKTQTQNAAHDWMLLGDIDS